MLGDDVDDDGGSHDGGDGVEGDDAGLAGQEADGVAEQGDDGAAEDGAGHENAVVGNAEQEVGDVGHGKADEHDGTAIGGGDGGEQTGDDEQPVAHAAGVDTEVLGILLAQEQGIEGLDEEQGADEPQNAERREEGYLAEGHAAEGAHAPDHVGLDALVSGEEVEQRDDAVGDVAYHDADNEQHDVVAHHGGEQEDEGHDGHGADEGGCQHGHEAADADGADADGAAETEHDEGHAHTGAAVDAEDAGTGEGVLERRLEHEAADGERAAAEHGGEGLRQSALHDDELPGGARSFVAGDDADDVGQWNRHGPHGKVDG